MVQKTDFDNDPADFVSATIANQSVSPMARSEDRREAEVANITYYDVQLAPLPLGAI